MARPMRLGVMAHASCGGSAKVASALAAAMAARGHVVHLFTRSVPFVQSGLHSRVHLHCLNPGEVVHDGLLHTDWSEREVMAFASMVVDTVLEDGLELLHFHYALPFAFVAHEVKLRLGRRAPALVGTLHGTDVSVHGRCSRTSTRLAASLGATDALTTVSRDHARLASCLMALPTPLTVIPNFVDLEQSSFPRPGMRRRPRIVHISNFRAVKDPVGMARIFLAVKEKLDTELWIVGDGPLLPQVRALLEPHGGDAVRYWGLQPVTGPMLAESDLLLMTSRMESFCLVALEAMAQGVPVLAPRVGGLPEVVTEGETGLLFAAGSQEQAVGLALTILRDGTERRRMSAAARTRARNFSSELIVPQYEELYNSVLRSRLTRLRALA